MERTTSSKEIVSTDQPSLHAFSKIERRPDLGNSLLLYFTLQLFIQKREEIRPFVNNF